MLRNVLEDYLSSILERDFDYPLMALLQAMGFHDIHFTHGGVEFGKDFIAKKIDKGVEYQYAIQSKKGDINQSLWRNEIRGQLEEAILSDLSHPQFDTEIPRKAVLVTTGRLIGNARLASQEFKAKLGTGNKIQELIFWEKEQLIQYSEEFGLSGIHQNTPKGLKGFAQFYLIYSHAIEGNLSEKEIEEFSRLWLDKSLGYKKRIFRASIEAEILASKLVELGLLYEAFTIYIALSRVVMQATYEDGDPFLLEIFDEIVSEKIVPLLARFLDQVESQWNSVEKSLVRLCARDSPLPMLPYLVWSARILEVLSLYYFLEKDVVKKSRISKFLLEFIEKENGCGHIPGDRYAITMVWITLALIQAGKISEAIGLIRRGAVWLCDRVEEGYGLARYEADEYEETITLLGYPFDFIKVTKNRSSYLATILVDLVALSGDKQLYADMVYDFEVCQISYNYWQFPDTDAIFTIETEECRNYPNIPHLTSLDKFENFLYSSHLKDEPRTFKIVEKVGKESLILLSILLKDRYFPKMWKQIIADS